MAGWIPRPKAWHVHPHLTNPVFYGCARLSSTVAVTSPRSFCYQTQTILPMTIRLFQTLSNENENIRFNLNLGRLTTFTGPSISDPSAKITRRMFQISWIENGRLFSGSASCLDAFSTYPLARSCPAMPCQTTGTPEAPAKCSSRTDFPLPSVTPHTW